MMQKVWNWIHSWKSPNILWLLIIALGIILRVRQYFSGRSFWSDEASLAYNLVNRTFAGLTQPLDYEQGAPIGFLFIEKFLIILLGNVDQVMRLFPLFSGIAAVFLIQRIAKDRIKSGWLAGLLFAISWYLVYYSSELKQYSSDVMVVLLMTHLFIRCLRKDVQRFDLLLLGAAGSIAIWISHPSAFILAGIGLAMVFGSITGERPYSKGWLFTLAAMWILSFGIQYLVSLRYLIADDYLQSYWRQSFMPMPPWDHPDWFVDTHYSLIFMTFNRQDPFLFYAVPVLMLIGCVSLLKRERMFAVAIIACFLATLLASALQRYPLKGRFLLFMAPLVILLVAESLGFLHGFLAKWHRGIAHTAYAIPALILFLLPATPALEHFITPVSWPDIRPVMEYVSSHRLEGNIVYVYHTADSTFHYYAPLYGLEGATILVGENSPRKRVALEGFYNDVETLRGNDRVWFLFSDIVDCGGCDGDMQAFYVDYLNGLGIQLDSAPGNGANAYLYDLDP
jgi:hypothetical protein